ncbi:hypothetical protein NQZ79_g2320 [Umbelopsis isabellina]|nr:hypothetical protein NQZ79_g2320 [Umbelopsis isabellina]
MAAAQSAAELNNTTVRLAALSLAEKQTPCATGLAETSSSNDASSSIKTAAIKESGNDLKVAVYNLIALATIQRPFLFTTVSELFKSCVSLVKTPTIQSDATSIIADQLRRLNIAVWDVADRVESTEREKTLQILAEWNTALVKHFNWDEKSKQFLSPIQVSVFLNWLVAEYQQGKLFTPEQNKIFRPRPGGLQDAINFFVTIELRTDKQLDTSAEDQLPQSATPVSPALSRQSIEHLVTYFSQEDTLDFLWYDEEGSDGFDMEETEDGDSDHSNEIFASATEISGAEVTDSDWSVLD